MGLKRRDSAIEALSPLADLAERSSPNHEKADELSGCQPNPQVPEPCRWKCLCSYIVRAPAVIPSEAPVFKGSQQHHVGKSDVSHSAVGVLLGAALWCFLKVLSIQLAS